jgi:ribosome maturation protein Sdo1
MAVIKYEINGKANTKPMKDTETAAQGMFKKISQIDNMLKGFVGVKVFAEVSKSINNSLKEYDKFKNSLNEETNLSKQMNSIKTSLAATLGTVRDELYNTFSNLANGDFMDLLKDIIPKAGASLVAAFRVGEAIVINIKNNFKELLHPEAWTDFFSHAFKLAGNFGSLLANVLRDAFKFSIEFFKWGFTDLNLFKLLWNPTSKFLEMFYKGLGFLGGAIAPGLEDFFNDIAKTYENPTNLANMATMPKFGFSDDTKNALKDYGGEFKATYGSLFSTLAGENVNTLYSSAYNEALNNLKITIDKMEQAANKNTEAVKDLMDVYKKNIIDTAKESISNVTSGFNSSSSNINNILGNAQYGIGSTIKESMRSLNDEFNETSKRITKLFDQLKGAKTVNEIEEIFSSINDGVGKIKGLTDSMNGLQEGAEKARNASELLAGIFSSIGDVGVIINAVMSSNPIGLLITLFSQLMNTFSKLSTNCSAFMQIFTVLFDVVGEICAELEPFLDAIFKPILDIIVACGRVLGSLLNIIMPIVSILMQLFDALDFLEPILNAVAMTFAFLADVIGVVYNAISWIVKKITFGLVDMGKAATNNMEKMLDSINQENDYSKYQNSNNTASYTVSGDMYININFSNSFCGDERAIALRLRDEIRAAERAGY